MPEPFSVGLSGSTRPLACNCASPSLAGRPGIGIASSASMLPSESTAFDVYAVSRAKPTACVAYAGVLPPSTNRLELKRRRTVSSNRLVTKFRTQCLASISTTRDVGSTWHESRQDQWLPELAEPDCYLEPVSGGSSGGQSPPFPRAPSPSRQTKMAQESWQHF